MLLDIYQSPRVNKSKVYELTWMNPMGTVLDTLDIEEHRRKCKIVSQPISERPMRTFEPTMVEEIDKFIGNLLQASRRAEPVNMTVHCRNLGGDIVGQLALRYPLNLQSDDTNHWLFPGLNIVTYRVNVYMQMPSLYTIDPLLKLLVRKQREKYINITRKMISTCLNLPRDAKYDLYSFAIDHMKVGTTLRNSELWAEAFFFLTAGGTTPSTVAEEIRSTFDSPDEIRMGDKLRSCEYLHACIDETLRIATPNTSILWREQLNADENGQKFNSPLTVDGNVMPPNTLVGVSLYSIHHNEEYFPDPWQFKPERWLGKAKSQEGGDANGADKAFAPFVLGSRSCTGRAVAYLELSLAIAKTLWHFDFESAPGNLGLVGGGQEGRTDGRGRPDEYQIYDTFTSTHDGPYLLFWERDGSAQI
ncbi:hypothetical protein S7711_10043 [Stachybotrys chartarum IBT 7711]|uniref:Cytochrome P450 n=1 Tax=Stachybotrys chartarum (strain CBS 109288 / IBT 7711) TaxID=1280523 RepID=A0A084AEX7_STACB|nr:hypothetical protein S7711_10043 [Stachybotrys chartarum IBT 7711]